MWCGSLLGLRREGPCEAGWRLGIGCGYCRSTAEQPRREAEAQARREAEEQASPEAGAQVREGVTVNVWLDCGEGRRNQVTANQVTAVHCVKRPERCKSRELRPGWARPGQSRCQARGPQSGPSARSRSWRS